MSDSAPRLVKWPFFLGDLVLISFAVYLVEQSPAPLSSTQAGICMGAIFIGACLAILPYLRDHRVALRLSEVHALTSSLAQLGHLEQIKSQILGATTQWQTIQQHSDESLAAAHDLSARMKSELGEFCEFLKRANDSEKNHLRLEVEKLRKSEGEWLQATVHLLDHVFALHKAASRSGQPALAAQLDQFQLACREIVRRLGLVPFTAKDTELFDPENHAVADNQSAPPPNSTIMDALAPGYRFQGRLVRRALVRVGSRSETFPAPEGVTVSFQTTQT
jgi:molecular chaperone GrpE (heat shock protein)